MIIKNKKHYVSVFLVHCSGITGDHIGDNKGNNNKNATEVASIYHAATNLRQSTGQL